MRTTMTDEPRVPLTEVDGETAKTLGHLLRQQERTLNLLEMLRDEMDSPTVRAMVDSVRKGTGLRLEDTTAQVRQRLEEAVRAVKLAQSELLQPYRSGVPVGGSDLPANLPPHLARFLAERQATPGFKYEVIQDSMRGWVVRWKEFTARGTVRGSGQFSERPYAWLEE
jgi:hypothetical protein